MANSLPWVRRVSLVLALPLCALPLLFAGQRARIPVSQPVARQSRFHDWTTRHALYPRVGTLAALEAARTDPRALFHWHEMEQHDQAMGLGGFRGPRRWLPRRSPASALHRDWSVSLGTAGTAANMYPAKFTFDVNATPSCPKDFVVFPVNAVGSTTQANIVAFNNLYSGTIGATNGICNGRTTPTGDTDTKTLPTVYWSYNVSGVAGAVTTSPVLSTDGSRVAFVESVAGSPAHFHVLAWKNGDGVGANLQNTGVPKQITTFATSTPAISSGTASDLDLGSSTTGTDTLSSPYIDYTRDLAYVGNDIGVLYRIKNVFCTLPACTVGAQVPALDTSWGTNGAVTVCTGKLTGPVLDPTSLNVFVGCSDGKLYAISQTGTVKSLTVGDGVASKTYGAIVDAPVVDSVNGFVYAVSGSANNGANGVLVQAKTSLASSVAVPIGVGNQCNLHAPTPNNAYFTSITSAGALMYVGGLGTTGTVTQPCTAASTGTATLTLYASTFTGTGTLSTGAPAHNFGAGGGPGFEWGQILEFFNATTNTDWLFASALQSNQTNVASWNMTTAFPTAIANLATEGLGGSGIVVDNAANTTTFPQAASIYFNALQQNAACNNNATPGGTGGCAVKLTQSGLQ